MRVKYRYKNFIFFQESRGKSIDFCSGRIKRRRMEKEMALSSNIHFTIARQIGQSILARLHGESFQTGIEGGITCRRIAGPTRPQSDFPISQRSPGS